MEVEVVNMKGKVVRSVELPAAVFSAPVRKDLMHQALVYQQAGAHLGTHKTKGRGEVRAQTVEAEGNRPGPPGIDARPPVARRREGPHSHPAGLFGEDAAPDAPSGASVRAFRQDDR